MKDKRTLILSVVAVALLVGAVTAGFSILGAVPAKAQTANDPAAPGMRMMGPGAGMAAGALRPQGALAATSRYVYVLRGGTLYQFSESGLKLTGKYEFPRAQTPAMGRRGRAAAPAKPAEQD